jgi:hypothetical protein
LLGCIHLSLVVEGGEVGLVQTVINALVVGAVGLFLARMTQTLRAELKGEIRSLRTELKGDTASLRAELKGDTASLRAELKREMQLLRTELKADIGEVRTEVRELRSDLTRVALAVGAERRTGSG